MKDERGSASVEYVIVLCLVSLGAVLSLAGLGVLLLRLFRYQQAVLVLPIS